MHRKIELPILQIPKSKDFSPFIPSDADKESAIVSFLETQGVVTLSAGVHECILQENPPMLHHPQSDKHSIYWLHNCEPMDSETSAIRPWQDDSWVQLANDTNFLTAAEQHFTDLQNQNPLLRIYHVYGFASDADRQRVVGLPRIAPRAAQSQYRGHIHLTSEISVEDCYKLEQSGVLQWRQFSDIFSSSPVLASLFLNQAAESMIVALSQELSSFGTMLQWQQHIGRKNNSAVVERTFFSFTTWSEALAATIELEQSISDAWLPLAIQAVQKETAFAGLVVQAMQGCRFSASIIKLSKLDCARVGFNASRPWLVAPCSVAIPPMLLAPAHLLQR